MPADQFATTRAVISMQVATMRNPVSDTNTTTFSSDSVSDHIRTARSRDSA
jgi:hypothetical protein